MSDTIDLYDLAKLADKIQVYDSNGVTAIKWIYRDSQYYADGTIFNEYVVFNFKKSKIKLKNYSVPGKYLSMDKLIVRISPSGLAFFDKGGPNHSFGNGWSHLVLYSLAGSFEQAILLKKLGLDMEAQSMYSS